MIKIQTYTNKIAIANSSELDVQSPFFFYLTYHVKEYQLSVISYLKEYPTTKTFVNAKHKKYLDINDKAEYRWSRVGIGTENITEMYIKYDWLFMRQMKRHNHKQVSQGLEYIKNLSHRTLIDLIKLSKLKRLILVDFLYSENEKRVIRDMYNHYGIRNMIR